MMLATVRQNGYAMSYSALGLKTDCDFVLVAVHKNWYALGSASTKMRSE